MLSSLDGLLWGANRVNSYHQRRKVRSAHFSLAGFCTTINTVQFSVNFCTTVNTVQFSGTAGFGVGHVKQHCIKQRQQQQHWAAHQRQQQNAAIIKEIGITKGTQWGEFAPQQHVRSIWWKSWTAAQTNTRTDRDVNCLVLGHPCLIDFTHLPASACAHLQAESEEV